MIILTPAVIEEVLEKKEKEKKEDKLVVSDYPLLKDRQVTRLYILEMYYRRWRFSRERARLPFLDQRVVPFVEKDRRWAFVHFTNVFYLAWRDHKLRAYEKSLINRSQLSPRCHVECETCRRGDDCSEPCFEVWYKRHNDRLRYLGRDSDDHALYRAIEEMRYRDNPVSSRTFPRRRQTSSFSYYEAKEVPFPDVRSTVLRKDPRELKELGDEEPLVSSHEHRILAAGEGF